MMLRVERLGVRINGKPIVEDVHFALAEGQWLMLVGPNGAGKSTLVNAIAQSIPYTGRVELQARDIRSYKPREIAQRLGVLSQIHSSGGDFTVEEVVSLGRYAHSRGFLSHRDDDGETRVENALRTTGLYEQRTQRMQSLSGGELQRAFLAQVFAQNPSILILDEPANHLDLVYQKQLFDMIGDWLKQPGRAVLSVVHDLSLARRFGTHALLMKDSRAAAGGPIETTLTREALQDVYGIDVFEWMKEMLAQWSE